MADTFTLDTSGAVRPPAGDCPKCGAGALGNCGFYGAETPREGCPLYRWSDLSPFAQGYGDAIARDLYERLVREGMSPAAAAAAVAFRNWAPETLARVLKDCEAAIGACHGSSQADLRCSALAGRMFWGERQTGDRAAFPPLTPTLGVDGRYYLREGA